MATMGDNAVFIDTNVLVYANIQEAPLYSQAQAALEQLWNAGTELWVSRQVLREYIAVCTRPQTFSYPIPMTVVEAQIRLILEQYQVADEDMRITEKLLALLTEVPCGGRQVHDANIVATMQVYGIRHVLTHNVGDYARFTAYVTVLPLEKDVSA